MASEIRTKAGYKAVVHLDFADLVEGCMDCLPSKDSAFVHLRLTEDGRAEACLDRRALRAALADYFSDERYELSVCVDAADETCVSASMFPDDYGSVHGFEFWNLVLTREEDEDEA